MSMLHHEHETERRYDPDTLRKVTQLAARMQSEHQESLTAREMEALGVEVGLDPAFVQKALALVESNQQSRQLEESASQTEQTIELHTERRSRTGEFAMTVSALGLPLFWGPLAYVSHASPGVMSLFTLLTPAPMAALIGFLTGRKPIASLSAGLLIAAVAPTFPYLYFKSLYPDQIDGGMMTGAILCYLMVGIPIATRLARMGASLRERYFPLVRVNELTNERLGEFETEEEDAPSELLGSRTIVRQTPERTLRRTFMSVDVAGAPELRASGTNADVEMGFAQYHRWLDEVMRACDGTTHTVSGDSRIYLFASESMAVRAARRLQEGLEGFNIALNRLPLPFHLRCGVSSGVVAIEPNDPAGSMRSPAIERASLLQQHATAGDVVVSGELAAAGLVELGSLSPLPESVGGSAAFSWRGAPKPQSAI